MRFHEISPELSAAIHDTGRTVLVRGPRSVTAIDLPTDAASLRALVDHCATLAPEGLRTAILTVAGQSVSLPEGVRVVRPGNGNESTLNGWLVLHGSSRPSEMVAVQDDAGRVYQIEPCLGSPDHFAVTIEPEQTLVVCDDLHAALPPRVEAGTVHETMMRMEDWRMREPRMIIPASGFPLRGVDALDVLDRGVAYLRGLYQRTRSGMVESRLPWERLMYTIPPTSVWSAPNADHARLVERHQNNVRHMAEDIWTRMQAEAEDRAIAA